MTEKRKIIQIEQFGTNNKLQALCDDGSVWIYSEAPNKWYKVPDIPQDDEPDAYQ